MAKGFDYWCGDVRFCMCFCISIEPHSHSAGIEVRQFGESAAFARCFRDKGYQDDLELVIDKLSQIEEATPLIRKSFESRMKSV